MFEKIRSKRCVADVEGKAREAAKQIPIFTSNRDFVDFEFMFYFYFLYSKQFHLQ